MNDPKTALLVMWALFSLICCPIMLIHSVDNIFGLFEEKAFWWEKEGAYPSHKTERVIDVIFFCFPLAVGLHWAIIAIWFPNFYK